MNSYENCKKDIDNLCINTIRTLTMDSVQKANSGHPGAPMGLASAGYILWNRIMRHTPTNPDWLNRDRFVLSGGHASMLLYSLLYLSGYDLELKDLKEFRQIGSKTPGHPEYGLTPGVETTTGPLGQGIANAVGMAIAERSLASHFNKSGYKIIDHDTYVFCGDGDLMEGVSSEAVSIAGHLGLSHLICLYDSNNVSIEGNTDITFTEKVADRFEAYGWNTLLVEDGNDLNRIETAFKKAKNEKDKPSIIILKTNIAYGSPNFQDTSEAHGAPLGEEEVRLTKKNLNWPENESFFVPKEVLSFFRKCIDRGKKHEESWLALFKNYSKKFPQKANELLNSLTGYMPNDWELIIPRFSNVNSPIETRTASGKILNSLASIIPTLIGGSSDLAPSNKTYIEDSCDFQKNSYRGRNIRFGVREFAMGGILTGMFLHGGVRPYGGTFLVFSDYMRSSIRMASIMRLPIIYIFTHDSIAVGEDGPTHQPIEQLASLRTIPGLKVIRPADANETSEAWKIAIQSKNSPIAIILTRQKLPILDFNKTVGKVEKGAYILEDCNTEPDGLIIATGSEVHIALEAKIILKNYNIFVRVISMPSWEIFEEQSDEYKVKVFPPNIKCRVAIEAGISLGWDRYVGSEGSYVCINNYGFSAPGPEVMKKFGYYPDNIVNKFLNILSKK